MSEIDELVSLLIKHIGEKIDATYFTLKLRSEFEPHGKASETFEFVWYLYLDMVPWGYTDSNGKWVNGTQPLNFKGRTAEEAVNRAIGYMRKRYELGR